ncbi:MAG: DNA-3-methyladenine glycosylase [Cyclobacteriaceae bacterium]
MAKLTKEFYLREDVVEIARDLIGKYLYTNIEGQLTGGLIVETEAYNGRTDKACHAYLNRNTNRTKVMFDEGGVSYVYLCYGIHYLFNIVTNRSGLADAILIRAIQPVVGLDIMESRRNMSADKTALTSGPGSMSKALGITKQLYGEQLWSDAIWLEDGYQKPFEIEERKRIGIDYAEEDKDLPWRFIMKGNKWVSKPNFGK